MIRDAAWKVRCLQGRRIRCESCRKPYTYLAQEVRRIAVTGVVFQSDEGMEERLRKSVDAYLRRRGGVPRWGAGMCPHCRRYQGWMVRASLVKPVLLWGLAPLLVGLALSPIPLRVIGGAAGSAVAFLGPLALGGLGLHFGLRRALRFGAAPPERADPLAITDDDAKSLLAHCRAIEGSPLVEWYLSVHEAFPEDAGVYLLGFRDLTGDELFPADLRTEAKAARSDWS